MGTRYNAVIVSTPSYSSTGQKGEIWKIEESVYPLMPALQAQILTDNPLFFLINSYTTGLQDRSSFPI